MHLAWKNTTFRAPALCQKFDQMLRLPRKVWLQNHQMLRLSQKVRLQNQQMARVPSKVTLQHHQMLRLPQKKKHRFLAWLLLYCSFPGWPAPFLNYSIPFLNLSFTLLSIPLLDISLTEHSFLNCSFTELAFDELCLFCTLLLPNYSSTELVLSWTIPLLNYALFLPFKSS